MKNKVKIAKEVHFSLGKISLTGLKCMGDPIQFTYGLSENVIIFDLGSLFQGQIQGQTLLKNGKFQNIIFKNIEAMLGSSPNSYCTMLY
jgi:hypothetical protein